MHARTFSLIQTGTGANIFSLVLCINNAFRQVIISATMMIVIITIFLNGGYTVGMLARLGIETGVDPGPYIEKVRID